MDRFGPHEVTAREAILGKPGALVCAEAIRGDEQGGLFGARDLNHRIHVADADRIEGECFGDGEAMAVPLGASAGADRDRQTERLRRFRSQSFPLDCLLPQLVFCSDGSIRRHCTSVNA
jgi:hypothetical protein